MKRKTQEAGRKLLVAVAFDERLETLIRSAERYCQLTGAALRLTHVCDPWAKSFLATVADKGALDLMAALKDEATRIAGRRLDALARSLDQSLKVETAVLSGDVAKSVAEDAEDNGASMIMVGSSRSGVTGTIQGFSTAISLVMESAVPVLVLNEKAEFCPKSDRPVIVACDDFTEVSSAALDVGFAVASSIEGSSLVHLHVESYGDMNAHGKLRDPKTNGAITPEQLEHMNRQAEEKMLERAGGRPAALEDKGGRYVLEIVTGSVPDEIERSAIAHRADLMILGQHKVFHRKSMHVGQVPYKAMLAQQRPVIVVPIQS
jgi:nucleotide-binding universal stress UspA family protein